MPLYVFLVTTSVQLRYPTVCFPSSVSKRPLRPTPPQVRQPISGFPSAHPFRAIRKRNTQTGDGVLTLREFTSSSSYMARRSEWATNEIISERANTMHLVKFFLAAACFTLLLHLPTALATQGENFRGPSDLALEIPDVNGQPSY